MKKIWHKLFLEERSSLSLSLFRVAVAFTVGAHVMPSFMQLADNYYPTAFKTFNASYFPVEWIGFVQQSPVWLINSFVFVFMVAWFFFFIGLFSQISCIVMTASCYYFYALNSFHVGTLSWDMLLVTVFLMCVTNYAGDYFSVDCLLRNNREAYARKRPYFIQRLLQMQIGFTFFYTAIVKTYPQGNWLVDNPIYYIMNYPPSGTTKWFLLREFLMVRPALCYAIGITVILLEFLMIFLLFWRRTRISAIYLGIIFHATLILTLDVPATFFFLFPPQLLLFINPDKILHWIDQKRKRNQLISRHKIIFDGQCRFCVNSLEKIKVMDLFNMIEPVDLRQCHDLPALHPQLTKGRVESHGGVDICHNLSPFLILGTLVSF